MNEEKTLIRRLTVYGGFTLAMLAIIGVSVISYSRYSEWRAVKIAEKKERDHQFAQEQIRDMIKFCDFAKLDADEQATIDKCGDDIIAVRTAIDRILDDRVTFWQSKRNEIENDARKLIEIKREAVYWDNNLEYKFTTAAKNMAAKYDTIKSNHEGWMKKREEFKTYNPLKKEKKFL